MKTNDSVKAAEAVAIAVREAGFPHLSPEGQEYLKARLIAGAAYDPVRGEYNLGGLKNLGFASTMADGWLPAVNFWLKERPNDLLPRGLAATPQQTPPPAVKATP